MGETGYNSSTYYRFATLDTEQLEQNLGSTDHLNAIINAFADAFVHAIPSGHQNSFAAHTRPAVVMAVVRQGQPVSLVDAFEDPISPKNGKSLLKALDTHWADLSKMYGETGVVYKGIVTRASLAAQLELPKNLAIQCMIHTHQLGRHFVIALPLTEAQEKVAIAHQRSQERKYPLRFTIEDEWL